MAETSRSLYNIEEVLNLLDEVFFPGSDDKLGLFEDDVDGSDNGSDDDSSDNDDGVESELDQEEERRYETQNCAACYDGDHIFQYSLQ